MLSGFILVWFWSSDWGLWLSPQHSGVDLCGSTWTSGSGSLPFEIRRPGVGAVDTSIVGCLYGSSLILHCWFLILPSFM